jgi:lysophospholipase L1-like esterase
MKRPNSHQYTAPLTQPSSNDDHLEEDEEAPILPYSQSSSQSSIQQGSLNMDAITSKKSRNSTLFTFTQAGTQSSRSGLYIRPSWKITFYKHVQNRIKTYMIVTVLLLCLRPLHLFNIHNKKNNNNNQQQDHNHSDAPSEDDDVISFSSEGYKSLSPTKEMKNIQHMCSIDNDINSNNNKYKGCDCLNPLDATEGTYPGWENAHAMNLQMAEEHYSHDTSKQKKFDVVFLGDSIVEEWNGRWRGQTSPTWSDIHGVWKELFDPSVTPGAMEALALGIAGDQIANLLWRIHDGEELSKVDSKVFWVLIGTNDLTQGCSEDVILLGIIHIVEQIQKLKPDAIVVLNGLLPRTNDPSGYLGDSHDGEIIALMKKEEQFPLVDGIRMNQTENGSESFLMDAHSTSSLENANAAETDDIEAEIDDIEADSVSSTTTSTTSASSHRTFWQSIQSINKGLASYAHQHDRVEYFDASDIFVAHLGNAHYHRNETFLMKELQGDFLHPTALGHKLWGEAIVDYIVSDLDLPPSLLRDFAN